MIYNEYEHTDRAPSVILSVNHVVRVISVLYTLKTRLRALLQADNTFVALPALERERFASRDYHVHDFKIL